MRRLLLALLAVAALSSAAQAQSTAQPVLPGALTTTSCPSGSSVCYKPYSASNPLAVAIMPASSGGLTPTSTSAAASELVVKASAGMLYAYQVTAGASAGYVMVFNATSAPVDGAVTPVKCVAIPANSSIVVTNSPAESFATGITIVFSTTGCFTKTASATAFITADYQ